MTAAAQPGFALAGLLRLTFDRERGRLPGSRRETWPQALPAEVGWRPIRVGFLTKPPPAGFHPYTAPLPGVLRGLHDAPGATDAAAAAKVGQELRRLTGLARAVVPPSYGRAHAASVAPWLGGLNSDPVARIAAATGARVVQAHQDELMASAWEQAADVQRARRQQTQDAVGVAVGETLIRRHLSVMPAERLFQVSDPAQIPGGRGGGGFRQRSGPDPDRRVPSDPTPRGIARTPGDADASPRALRTSRCRPCRRSWRAR